MLIWSSYKLVYSTVNQLRHQSTKSVLTQQKQNYCYSHFEKHTTKSELLNACDISLYTLKCLWPYQLSFACHSTSKTCRKWGKIHWHLSKNKKIKTNTINRTKRIKTSWIISFGELRLFIIKGFIMVPHKSNWCDVGI